MILSFFFFEFLNGKTFGNQIFQCSVTACAILFLKSSGWRIVNTVNFRVNQLQMTCSRIHRSIIHRAVYSIRWIHLRICRIKLNLVRFKFNLIPAWSHFWDLNNMKTVTCGNTYLCLYSVEFWRQNKDHSLEELKFWPERKYIYFPKFSFAVTYKHQIHI